MLISLHYVFWIFVAFFAVIGYFRGWAKELLVGFAVIVALALNYLLQTYVPIVKGLPQSDPESFFWLRVIVLVTLTFFGYQTVISVARFQAASRRERLQDALFGMVLGAFNGYLIFGTVWVYWAESGYVGDIVRAGPPALQQLTENMLKYMPPNFIGIPGVYFAVIVVLVFILVVYV